MNHSYGSLSRRSSTPCYNANSLTFHRQLQGDVHVAQIPKAALYYQLGSPRAFASRGPVLITHNAALPKGRRPVLYGEGGEALLAETPVPTAAGPPVTRAFSVSPADITCKRGEKTQRL